MTRPDRDTSAVLRDEHKSVENLVVLYITQAMLGLTSPPINAVAVEVTPERLVVHFALAELDGEIEDDIETMLGDLDALLYNEDLPKDWKIESRAHVGPADEQWPGVWSRRVYEAKRRV